jgi:hypothetical protein
MIWVSWRQFRGQAVAAAALLVVVGLILGITGIHLAHLYTAYQQNLHTCNALSCESLRSKLLGTYQHVKLIGSLLIGVPAIIGLFWGAPLVTRELDAGTHRLAWTQSVTRTRWLLTKLGLVGLASMVAAGLFSLAVTLWAMPYDRVNANHLSPALFDQRGIAPIAYAAFAFVLGVTVGLLVKRTLPAMAITLVGFIATRMVTQYLLRPHLFAPLHQVSPLSPSLGVGIGLNNGQVSIDAGHPNLHGGWITSSKIVDATGHSPTSDFVRRACSAAINVPPPSGSGQRVHAGRPAQQAFTSCISNVGARFHEVIAYQPNSRFWEFQWAEAGIFLGLAVLLAVACVGLVRRRLA